MSGGSFFLPNTFAKRCPTPKPGAYVLPGPWALGTYLSLQLPCKKITVDHPRAHCVCANQTLVANQTIRYPRVNEMAPNTPKRKSSVSPDASNMPAGVQLTCITLSIPHPNISRQVVATPMHAWCTQTRHQEPTINRPLGSSDDGVRGRGGAHLALHRFEGWVWVPSLCCGWSDSRCGYDFTKT